ncbi:MAG: hypothetical protein S4CHLAM102_06920 [Chlamydiia bacterium]|nr:hypothetical protein [Chlamydiia bacterium]
MLSFTIIPIVLIPAAALLALMFNQRITHLLKGGDDKLFTPRMKSLKSAIYFQYLALLLFTGSICLILLASFSFELLLIACFTTFFGVLSMFVGILMALIELHRLNSLSKKPNSE